MKRLHLMVWICCLATPALAMPMRWLEKPNLSTSKKGRKGTSKAKSNHKTALVIEGNQEIRTTLEGWLQKFKGARLLDGWNNEYVIHDTEMSDKGTPFFRIRHLKWGTGLPSMAEASSQMLQALTRWMPPEISGTNDLIRSIQDGTVFPVPISAVATKDASFTITKVYRLGQGLDEFQLGSDVWDVMQGAEANLSAE